MLKLAIITTLIWLCAGLVSWLILPSWEVRGQFGDLFGAVNALFSGLAFAGLYSALKIQQTQLELQRNELHLQREAMAEEVKRRTQEESQKQLGSANRAIFTIFQYWNTLEQYRKEIIEPFRGQPDLWLNLAANPVSPIAQHSLKADDLQFLLQTPKAQVFAELLQEEQRFILAMAAIRERSELVLNEVFPRMARAGFNVGRKSTEAEVEAALGIDITHKLKTLSSTIVRLVDEDLASLRQVHDSFRGAVRELHPGQKVLEVQFHK